MDEDVAQWQLAASMMHRRRLRAGVVAAVLLLAAVVAEAQCPSKEQFDACVSEATVRYNLAAGDLQRAGTCFKSRACEFLKDVFFCGANDMECCTEDVSTTYRFDTDLEDAQRVAAAGRAAGVRRKQSMRSNGPPERKL